VTGFQNESIRPNEEVRMTKTSAFAFIIFLLLVCPLDVTAGAVDSHLKVEQSSICREIQSLTPIGEGTFFPGDIPKLYCFTKVKGARQHTSVTHIWYYGSREMARITLPVRAPSWRTYSSLTFYENWPGRWSGAVVSPNNVILKLLTFNIEKKVAK